MLNLIPGIIFLSGILNILSSFFSIPLARPAILNKIFSLEIIHASRILTLIFGVFLIYLARGLYQRKYRSWLFTIILLVSSSILHLIKGLDFFESIILLMSSLILYKYRNYYVVKSGRSEILPKIKIAFTVLVSLLIYSFFGYMVLQKQFSLPVTALSVVRDYLYNVFGLGSDVLVPLTKEAKIFEGSVITTGFVSILFIMSALFVPFIDVSIPEESQIKLAKKLLKKYAMNSTSYLSLMDDKNLFFTSFNKCFLSYKIYNNVAVVLGDPIGDPKEISLCIREYIEKMKLSGLSFAFYNVLEENLKKFEKFNMKFLKVGEEAIIDVQSFNLNTPQMKDVRYGFNKMVKEGIDFNFYDMTDIPWKLMVEINKLHNKWLASKKGPALTYSLDYYPFPADKRAAVLTASYEDKLLGVFSFFPYLRGKGMVLELMLRAPDSPNGLVEASLAQAISFFREESIQEVSLGLAPLSNTGLGKEDVIEKGEKFIFERVNRFYGYRSLFDFKRKFNPRWRPKYLVYPGSLELPKVAMALFGVHIRQKGVLKSILS